MTVATQVKTCIASLKSAQASLEQFALATQNQDAKTLFKRAPVQTDNLTGGTSQWNNKLIQIL